MPISVLFQSTLPRRERPETNRNYMRTCINFNPHSHEGSDLVTDSPPFSCSISIHTPTKGATHFFLQLRQSFSYFNPHSHEGSDVSSYFMLLYIIISIHTPTKGATLTSSTSSKSYTISIHTPTKGATRSRWKTSD